MEMKKKEEYLQAVWFAAGTAVLMACLKRAALVSLVEQWRLCVFLVLNLLLLAILFTSTCSAAAALPDRGRGASLEISGAQEEAADEAKTDRTAAEEEEEKDGGKERKRSDDDGDDDEADPEDDEEATKPTLLMSKEELNERAEAFIAMFRQRHLVSDPNTTDRCRFKSFA